MNADTVQERAAVRVLMVDIVTCYSDRKRRTIVNNVLSELGAKYRTRTLVEIEKLPLKGFGVIFLQYDEAQHERLLALHEKVNSEKTSYNYWLVIVDTFAISNSAEAKDKAESLHSDATLGASFSKRTLSESIQTAYDSLNALAKCESFNQLSLMGPGELGKLILKSTEKKSTNLLLHLLEAISDSVYHRVINVYFSKKAEHHLTSYHLHRHLLKIRAVDSPIKIEQANKTISLLMKNGRYKRECYQVRFRIDSKSGNSRAAMKSLYELQGVIREDSKVFTRLAIESIRVKHKTTTLKALSRYIATQRFNGLNELLLSIYLIVEESQCNYVWAKNLCLPILKNYARRVPLVDRELFWVGLALIDSIGLMQSNKPASASVRFEWALKRHQNPTNSNALSEFFYVLVMIYCSKAGRWSRIKAGIEEGLPTQLNPRVKEHLKRHVNNLCADMNVISTSIETKNRAKKAIEIGKQRKGSSEVMLAVASNLAKQYTLSQQYQTLLNTTERSQAAVSKAEKTLGLHSTEIHFDVKSEKEKVLELSRNIKESHLKSNPSGIQFNASTGRQSWISRIISSVNNHN